ncbi:MAG: glutamine-hydrolyzing carbamoyl-phosphate synthase small subunit, partial [Chloroflexota bacterium]
SYCGQIVTMTYPHIGNVGVNPEDTEATNLWAAGLIVREVSRRTSNWRASQSLPDYLAQNNIPGITELNTRALVRHIRSKGAMMAACSSDESLSSDDLVDLARSAPSMEGSDLVKTVTCDEAYHWNEGVPAAWQTNDTQSTETSYNVVAYDFGIKHNILRLLTDAGCRVTVVPATTSAQEVLALNPDGIFLSNGPGDPAAVTYAIDAVGQLVDSNLPMFGICLGHQILGLALGGSTHKLKFGHRGGNQPVRDESTGAVTITSHNHGFAISGGSLPDEVEVSHINLNDNCIEGLRHTTKPIFSIQYHPEASPGPHDATSFFQEFAALMDGGE